MPTSLTYIVLSTRGCSPWRPAAVMSTTRSEICSFPRIFKGRRERTGHHEKCGALPGIEPYLRVNRFQGDGPLKRKENSFRGPRRRLRVQLRCRCEFPHPGSGILTRFPFDRRRALERIAHIKTEFPYLLGSTNPCPTAVHMEPFSTSVFKVLI